VESNDTTQEDPVFAILLDRRRSSSLEKQEVGRTCKKIKKQSL
jgi:hypothetical protein